jgi:hypothetical protein
LHTCEDKAVSSETAKAPDRLMTGRCDVITSAGDQTKPFTVFQMSSQRSTAMTAKLCFGMEKGL